LTGTDYQATQEQFTIELLKANPEKINWNCLCTNPAAIHLLEANIEKINWYELSKNPAAIHLLEANIEKVNWYELSKNPAIFEYDYIPTFYTRANAKPLSS
jgi:hypothetical protein